MLVAQSCLTVCEPIDYIALQVPPTMGFSRQEYWSGFPFTSLRNPSNPRIEPRSPTLQADSLLSEQPWNHLVYITILLNLKYAPLHFLCLKKKQL